MLEKLMDEPGARIICGDTTAEIAARLLGLNWRWSLDRRTAGWWCPRSLAARAAGH